MFETPKPNIQSAPVIKAQIPTVPVQPTLNVIPKDERLINREQSIMNFARKFSLTLIVILVLLIIVLSAGYYYYIARFNKQIDSLQKEYTAKIDLNEQFKDWQNNIALLEAEQAKFLQMVPEKKELGLVLIQLEKMAEKYNLVFNAIANKTDSFDLNTTSDKQLQSQRYEVTLSGGDYFTLKKFLTEIESSLRIVAPQSLIYSPDVNMFVLTFDIYHR